MIWDFDSLEGVEAIIEHIGGVRPFAARMQVAVGTVQGWKKRGKIPANRRSAVETLLAEGAKKDAEKDAEAEKESPQEASPAASGEEKESSSLDLMGDDFSENDSAIEEGLVSAFTNQPGDEEPAQAQPDPESKGSEVNITEEVWEHAALPRSTAGQWAILLSIISIAAVLTRPLWADRIDRKLMTIMHGEETHKVEEGEATHDGPAEPEGAEEGAMTRSDLNPLSPPKPETPSELTERLSRLEKEIGGLLSAEKEEGAPFKASLREMKSEVDALGAAFDNQNARLDAIRRTLVLQREESLGIANRIDAVETQRDTARLSRRLQALFLLDRLSYAIEHAQPFSIKDLRGVLSEKERADFSEFLQVLEKTKQVISESALLRAYRRLLPALLATREHEEGIWARLRAQIFSVFSVRRIEGDDSNPLLKVERMIEESRLNEAQKTLNEELATQKTNFSAKNLGASTRARLLTFIRDLRTRNEAFEAVSSMQRRVISLEGGAQSSTSQP